MNETWKIEKKSNSSLVDISSNQSNWLVAEDLTYNNALTIITHFNKLGRVKIDKEGNAE